MLERPYRDSVDLQRALDVLLAQRADGRVDCYPTLWRLWLLLSSRLWEPARDARFWEDAEGHATAFAALTSRRRQDAVKAVELIVRPEARSTALASALLDWVDVRASQIAEERGAPVGIDIADQDGAWGTGLHTLLEHRGYRLEPDHDVYMTRPLDRPIPHPEPATGFAIRRLAGPEEVDAYQALYSFAPVDRKHRLELLCSPEYVHLVAVAPNGALAAYCECSISHPEWAVSLRRNGWVDYIGTRDAHRRLGLGRSLLLEGLRILQEVGADTAMLVTMSRNTGAQSVYTAAGFTLAGEQRHYTCEYAPSQR